MKKNELIEKMINQPLAFDDNDIDDFISLYLQPNGKYNLSTAFSDLRTCLQRVYDLNDKQLLETSNANKGFTGFLNKISTNCRQRKYFKRVENQKKGTNYIKIYVEGDSWFQFPLFVKDVVDWLLENKNYLLYSETYGGDWITNIIYEGQYVESLTLHAPDVFIISGGGNDLVGNSRLAIMISANGKEKVKYTKKEQIPNHSCLRDEIVCNILKAQPFITKEFYAYINIIKMQYLLLFKGLYSKGSKHQNIISITQGYAYPFPKRGVNFSFRYPLQPFVNYMVNSGQWLYRPLMLRGISDPQLQRAIVLTFIFEFNEMLKDLSDQGKYGFENVKYIDCRDIPNNQDDWFDELHLKSHKYKDVAAKYINLINSL